MVDMGNLRRLTWIVLVIGLLAAAGHAIAETDWEDSVTDPAGDVEDTGGTVVDVPGADILFVTITDDGDDVNVSMSLVGAYIAEGMYSVYVEVDGGDSWSFTRMTIVGFMVSDENGDLVSSDGYYSEDGKTISWVVAKTDIPATSSLDIEFASSTIVSFSGGATVTDYAGLGGGPSGDMSPAKMEWLFHFPKLNKMEMKITMTYTGDGAAAFRAYMDSDEDGTITKAEADAFAADMFDDDEPEDPSEANVTLDGEDPTDLDQATSMTGATGPADSTADLTITVKMTLTFPEPEDADTHEVEFEEPFGDDLIDVEDLPDEVTVTFKFRAPDGWVFKTDSVPSKMKDYLNDDGDEVSMNAADIQKDWNNTFANLQSFTIEKADSPGFGLLFVVVAATVAALAVGRRK